MATGDDNDALNRPWPGGDHYKVALEKIAQTPGVPIGIYEQAADALCWARKFRTGPDGLVTSNASPCSRCDNLLEQIVSLRTCIENGRAAHNEERAARDFLAQEKFRVCNILPPGPGLYEDRIRVLVEERTGSGPPCGRFHVHPGEWDALVAVANAAEAHRRYDQPSSAAALETALAEYDAVRRGEKDAPCASEGDRDGTVPNAGATHRGQALGSDATGAGVRPVPQGARGVALDDRRDVRGDGASAAPTSPDVAADPKACPVCRGPYLKDNLGMCRGCWLGGNVLPDDAAVISEDVELLAAVKEWAAAYAKAKPTPGTKYQKQREVKLYAAVQKALPVSRNDSEVKP